jgi:hypothetical protein
MATPPAALPGENVPGSAAAPGGTRIGPFMTGGAS